MRPGFYWKGKACSKTENRRDFSQSREEWQESVFGVWKGCRMQLGLACSTEGFVICNYVVLRRPVVLCPATERLFVGQHNVSRLWKTSERERERGICLQPSKIHPHNERESEWKVIQWRASPSSFYDHFNPVVWLFSLNILILFHALQFHWILPFCNTIFMTLFIKVFLSIVPLSYPVPLNSQCQGCFPTTGLIISLGQLCFTPLL